MRHTYSDGTKDPWTMRDRQLIAAVLVGLFGILLPVLILLPSLFAAGWMWILGIPGGHAKVFGWLSHKTYSEYHYTGRPYWHIARWPAVYYFCILSAYIGYQLLEAVALAFRLFKQALS